MWLRSALVAVLVAAAGVVVWAGAAAAQSRNDRDPRELIHAYKVWKLTDVLDLSDEQMPVFFSKIKRVDDLEVEAFEAERDAARRIGSMLERGEVGDRDLEQALGAYEQMRSERWEEMQSVRREALSMLSVRQRCRFVVFEERFRDEMRQMIGRARDLRRGAGQGSGGEGRGWDGGSGDERGGETDRGGEGGHGSGGSGGDGGRGGGGSSSGGGGQGGGR